MQMVIRKPKLKDSVYNFDIDYSRVPKFRTFFGIKSSDLWLQIGEEPERSEFLVTYCKS